MSSPLSLRPLPWHLLGSEAMCWASSAAPPGPARTPPETDRFDTGRDGAVADDLHLTAEALAAGRLLGIALLDHLVIGHDAYASLRDRGVAFDRAETAIRVAN